MAYRNGTYVAFHAEGTADPTESDMKYYRLLQAWNADPDHPLYLTNSHEKTSSVRDTSSRETLRRSLVTRLQNSKNMVLILSEATRLDRDWVPFEITYAIDQCAIPIIAAYPGYDYILETASLAPLWPGALRARIYNNTAHVIHIPFRKEPLVDAIPRFSHDNYPLGGGWGYYAQAAYEQWGII